MDIMEMSPSKKDDRRLLSPATEEKRRELEALSEAKETMDVLGPAADSASVYSWN